MSIRHWSWFTFWRTLLMSVKWGKSIHKFVSPGYHKYPRKHPCLDWEGRFSRICSGVIGVIPSKQTDPSLEFPLFDTISWRLLGLVSIPLNPWFAWIPCLPLHSLTLVKYSAVIVIFRFKRYCQISLLIAVSSWFLVPPIPIFINYDRAVMLYMRIWTDIASLSFIVKDIIANLAALSSKTCMWNFRCSIDHGPPVVSPWQLAPQPCNDASELIIICGGEKLRISRCRELRFFPCLHRDFRFLLERVVTN